MIFTLLGALALSMFQPVQSAGVDLNPALLGCIMSEGDCMNDIPIIGGAIGSFFDRTGGGAVLDRTQECYWFNSHWEGGFGGYNPQSSGHEQCRDTKKRFYKRQQVLADKWPDLSSRTRLGLLAYYDEVEEKLSKGDVKFFDCTPEQKSIFLKYMCSKEALSIKQH